MTALLRRKLAILMLPAGESLLQPWVASNSAHLPDTLQASVLLLRWSLICWSLPLTALRPLHLLQWAIRHMQCIALYASCSPRKGLSH